MGAQVLMTPFLAAIYVVNPGRDISRVALGKGSTGYAAFISGVSQPQYGVPEIDPVEQLGVCQVWDPG